MWEPRAVLPSRSHRGSASKIENGTASKSTKGSQPSASWEREQGSMRAGREGRGRWEAWSTTDYELSHHKRQVPRAWRSAPNGQQRLLELRSSAPTSLLSVSHSGAGSTVSPEAGLPLNTHGEVTQGDYGRLRLVAHPLLTAPTALPRATGDLTSHGRTAELSGSSSVHDPTSSRMLANGADQPWEDKPREDAYVG